MPVLSNYWFQNTDFRGNTEFLSQPHCAGYWAWINWSNIGSTESTLVWEQSYGEIRRPAALRLSAGRDASSAKMPPRSPRHRLGQAGDDPHRIVT